MNATHHRYATVQDRQIFYREAGPSDAPTIVLLHGFPTSSFMFRDLIPALADCGIPPERVHTELFEARSAINPGVTDAVRRRPHPPTGEPGTGPDVTFARSGLTVPWPAEGRTLLEFAESCDVPTRWSCRTGVCHTCTTNMLSGDVDYDPEPLEQPEPGDALLCCSRPRTAVVLDL